MGPRQGGDIAYKPRGRMSSTWVRLSIGPRVEMGKFILEHHSQTGSNEKRKYKKEIPIMRLKSKGSISVN